MTMSSSLTTTWSPSSSQLRFAFATRKAPPSVAFIRTRIRMFSVPENRSAKNIAAERRRSGDSWAVIPNSASDGYAGWTGVEQSTAGMHSRKSLKRFIGAGVAGVVLTAGIIFAVLSVGNRGKSRVVQQMETPTEHQQGSLPSDYDDRRIKEVRNDSEVPTQDGGNEQQLTSLEKDVASNTEKTEFTGSRNSNDTDIGDASANIGPPVQENDLSLGNMSVAPEKSPEQPDNEVSGGSFAIASSENDDVNLITRKLELRSELESEGDSLITNSSILDENMANTINDQQTRDSISSSKPSQSEANHIDTSLGAQLAGVFEPKTMHNIDIDNRSSPATTVFNINKTQEVSGGGDESSVSLHKLTVNESAGTSSISDSANPYGSEQLSNKLTVTESSGASSISNSANPYGSEQLGNPYQSITETRAPLDFSSLGITYTSAVIPAPSNLSIALEEFAGKVLVPAVVDQAQSQALAALQALKVIEADVQAGDLCTRREYARWLVSASSALTRSTMSKVYPAMYIENVTELAFDDVTPEHPDFPFIQGLAEAGLISSKLSRRDMQSSLDDDSHPVFFYPERPLSRQDLVSWKMALEKKQLPVVDRKILQQLSGFLDIDKINPDAWPAIVADIAAGEQGIMALSFGYTRLFQPNKPVTIAQAAMALATGEASDMVEEELARIEAESMAEKVVAAHNALVAQVEQDVNASYEKELQQEREKIGAVEKLAVETRQEIERLRAQREEENLALMKERAAVDSEMEVLSRLRREVEEQLQSLMTSKVEISYEKESLIKLRKDAETENQEIARLQYELEVERKALSMARAWAEDEAKRARDQAKSLEEARERWERQGIKVVVDDDLREEENVGVTWVAAGSETFVEGAVDRAESLVDRLKRLAEVVTGKSRETVERLAQIVLSTIHRLKELILRAERQAMELKGTAVSNIGGSLQDVQQSSVQFASAAKDGIKRFVGDCREGVEKITQKFKT